MILWDNAYACHDLKPTINQDCVNNVARKFGVWNNLFHFSSTSKITLAGSGISFLSMSSANIKKFIDYRNSVTPGPNKMNQGLHVKYFNEVSLEQQMDRLKEIILPKFDLVENYLSELKQDQLGEYISPTGGYFFFFQLKKGRAKKIISLCNELGLKLLPVGSCHPYSNDFADSTIRIAPTFPDIESLDRCMQIFSKVVKYLNLIHSCSIKVNMKNILLFLFLSVASLTVSTEELKWNAKFRLDLLEIKGPPSVEDVMNIRANKIADLDLLINSGKYDPEEIACASR